MMIRGQFSDFYMETMLPAIRAKIFEAQRRKEPKAPKIFRIESSTRSIETTIDLVEDDKIGLVGRMATELGNSEVDTREVQAASVFNNAFSTGDYVGRDGAALCSASHPLYKAGGNQSNILGVAADLDVDSLELALTDWELMKRSNGQQVSLPTPRLLIAPANRWRAHEILKGTMRSDTANNTVNAFKFAEDGPVSDIIVWSKLTDADAWFLVAPPESTGLVWYWRVKPYTRGFFDDRNERGGTIRRYKASWGFDDYIGVFGTAGAA
jgi:hypothetical protein